MRKGQVSPTRQYKLTSLVDERPRCGWKRPRIVKNHGILYPKKYIYKKNKVVYGYVLDGIATAIGEVGISDYMAYIFKHPRYRQYV
jgi:hypothetical protein